MLSHSCKSSCQCLAASVPWDPCGIGRLPQLLLQFLRTHRSTSSSAAAAAAKCVQWILCVDMYSSSSSVRISQLSRFPHCHRSLLCQRCQKSRIVGSSSSWGRKGKSEVPWEASANPAIGPALSLLFVLSLPNKSMPTIKTQNQGDRFWKKT